MRGARRMRLMSRMREGENGEWRMDGELSVKSQRVRKWVMPMVAAAMRRKGRMSLRAERRG